MPIQAVGQLWRHRELSSRSEYWRPRLSRAHGDKVKPPEYRSVRFDLEGSFNSSHNKNGLEDHVKTPPYAYVPGFWPHPSRDPKGHSFGQSQPESLAMASDDWVTSAAYVDGIELFNSGYYWEAHELWEELWRAAGRAGIVGELFRGLIKLAAAGIKVRQSRPQSVVRLGHHAEQHFEAAQRELKIEVMGGLKLSYLIGFARYVAEEGPGLTGHPTRTVEVVFQRSLTRNH